MTVYYNEFDPKTAAWLRVLIAQGHIAPGVVDERSIEDVRPSDLQGFTQCHFFAGIGVWSYALRRAGWRDDRSIWTGSCPCQPFSAAGKGTGFDDERHLWPAFLHLIQECKPASILGEQVASKDADSWLDLVQTDLEALDYAFGAVAFPSAGVGAPHIRDRTYWVAHAASAGQQRRRSSETGDGRDAARVEPERLCDAGGLGDDDDARLEGLGRGHQAEGGWLGTIRPASETGEFSGLADMQIVGREGQYLRTSGGMSQVGASDIGSAGWLADDELQQRSFAARSGHVPRGRDQESTAAARLSRNRAMVIDSDTGAGPTNGHWRDADWLGCRDGKWRPVEPGTFPLANGAAARVVRLRGYGNAINAEAAKAWIETVMECFPC